MPWRLITFVVILGFVVIFAGLNTTNTSDVSFGFWVVEDVPIFISLFFAFAVGVIIMMPFLIGKLKGRKSVKGGAEPPLPPDVDVPDAYTPEAE